MAWGGHVEMQWTSSRTSYSAGWKKEDTGIAYSAEGEGEGMEGVERETATRWRVKGGRREVPILRKGKGAGGWQLPILRANKGWASGPALQLVSSAVETTTTTAKEVTGKKEQFRMEEHWLH